VYRTYKAEEKMIKKTKESFGRACRMHAQLVSWYPMCVHVYGSYMTKLESGEIYNEELTRGAG
jgi:hypothetical protein